MNNTAVKKNKKKTNVTQILTLIQVVVVVLDVYPGEHTPGGTKR